MTRENARAQLDRQIEAMDSLAAELGARSKSGSVKRQSRRCYDERGKVLKMPRRAEWFVRKQICGESSENISNESPATYKDPDAVRDACREFSKLIGLTLRRDKPGPNKGGKHR